jgi:ribonuclease HI
MILKLGTDGSFHQEKETASFGWVLLGNQTLLVRGAGPVDGVPSMMSSTRAELFGIASPNEFLYHFMKFHQIESTSKCLKCVDNKAAISQVNRMQNKHSRHRRYSNDVDVLTVIIDRMKESTLQHRLRWVKAHQDDKKPYEDLDKWG